MKMFRSRNNNDEFKVFLIPRDNSERPGEYVEVSIDNLKLIFLAKNKTISQLDPEIWEICEQYTFPSSLLGEFLLDKGA